MSITNILLILFSVSLSSLAQLFLKMGADTCISRRLINLETLFLCVSNIYFWLGFLCYAVSLLVWVFILSRMSVSLAYPFLSFGIILSIFLSNFFLGEPITVQKILGIFFISIGLIVLTVK